MPLSVFFWALRRGGNERPRSINAGYPYIAIWLLAASAANQRGVGFYVGICALLAWPLLLNRPRHFHWIAPLGMLFLVAALGYAGQLGLRNFQVWVEGAVPEWMAGSGSRTDPYRSSTEFGEVGRLKESDDIVMRVVATGAVSRPLLLHRSSYDFFSGGTWIARNGAFTAFDGKFQESRSADRLPAGTVSIHDFSASGNPVLALPIGPARIQGLPAGILRRNALGTVQAEAPPGFLDYAVDVAADGADEAPPTESDLRLPAAEQTVLREVVAKAGLAGQPSQVVSRLRGYFSTGFTYSTYLEASAKGRTPLADFLLSTHTGHCEYFATASVLLARAAGVPARYATGFSALEYSSLEGAYLVRTRHAHAWARAFVDGRWQDLDTTPPTWIVAEDQQSSAWRPLLDVVSWGRYRLYRWISGLSKTVLYGSGGLIVLMGLLWIARGTLRGRGASLPGDRMDKHAGQAPASGKSPFHAVEVRLADLGWRRERAEPILSWLDGIARHTQLEPEILRQLARLHYKLRYDPDGLDGQQSVLFARDAAAWLDRHPASDQAEGKTVGSGMETSRQ